VISDQKEIDMGPQHEAITKAAQCAGLLVSDIRGAHRLACQDNPLLEVLLRELIADAVRLNRRLAEIEGCLR
jgi:hypothetical protein